MNSHEDAHYRLDLARRFRQAQRAVALAKKISDAMARLKKP